LAGDTVLFYAFAAIMVLASLLVVGQRSPIYSVLLLIVSFAALAGLYVLLDAPFLAVVQIIIYAGAIMVLFLFVVMLLNAPHEATGLKTGGPTAAGGGPTAGATGLKTGGPTAEGGAGPTAGATGLKTGGPTAVGVGGPTGVGGAGGPTAGATGLKTGGPTTEGVGGPTTEGIGGPTTEGIGGPTATGPVGPPGFSPVAPGPTTPGPVGPPGFSPGARGPRWAGAALALVLLVELAWSLWRAGAQETEALTGQLVPGTDLTSVRQIGRVLFIDYGFAFEVTSVLILVAMVGAVVLAKREI
jgi:NADH:ubiquinone oxidoreductase subunit 6 (subunit J)